MSALVGILNVTPDSFATEPLSPDAMREAAAALIDAGADVIDIGAESTRPGATPLSPDAEWARLAPCLADTVALAHGRGVAVSLDTRHPATAAKGIAVGIDIVNDVTGCGPAMAAVVAPARCRIVVMHALSVPVVAGEALPDEVDAVAQVSGWLAARIAALEAAGIARGRIILDPGVGFGKTKAQSVALCAGAPVFADLGCRVLIGHSRKSFLTLFRDGPAAERDDVTLAVSAILMARGVDYLRVHAVAAHRKLRDTLCSQTRPRP